MADRSRVAGSRDETAWSLPDSEIIRRAGFGEDYSRSRTAGDTRSECSAGAERTQLRSCWAVRLTVGLNGLDRGFARSNLIR